MTTQTHTPGPWRLGNQPSNVIAWRVTDSADRDVAHVFGSDLKSKGNARLIAAAPELLAALKRVVAAAEDGDEMTAIELAEAAIARAEGGQ